MGVHVERVFLSTSEEETAWRLRCTWEERRERDVCPLLLLLGRSADRLN